MTSLLPEKVFYKIYKTEEEGNKNGHYINKKIVIKDESEVQQELQIHGMHYGCNLMRNNSGALPDKHGTPVRFGLGNISKKHNKRIKSSDLIGITKIVITPEMVGQTLGVFTAVEVKDPDWNEEKKFDERENAQNNFINWVKSLGGFAGFANSIDKLENILRR